MTRPPAINGFVSLQCGALRHHACDPSNTDCQCTCHHGVVDVATSAPAVGAEPPHNPATDEVGAGIGIAAKSTGERTATVTRIGESEASRRRLQSDPTPEHAEGAAVDATPSENRAS